jgi:hypothetical protein
MADTLMIIETAYDAFNIGSPGFCRYISEQAHGLCISRTEAAAIAAKATTASEFLDIWANEEMWQDCHNSIDAL